MFSHMAHNFTVDFNRLSSHLFAVVDLIIIFTQEQRNILLGVNLENLFLTSEVEKLRLENDSS